MEARSGETAFEFHERLLRERVVEVTGEITDDAATLAIAHLLYLQHMNLNELITFRIDSHGGSIPAAMALVDTIRQLRPPVRTVAMRRAQGMAVILLASGGRGNRGIGIDAELSIEPIRSYMAQDDDWNTHQRKLVLVISELTGQEQAIVSQDLMQGRSFTASEAIGYGLVDTVVTPHKPWKRQ